MAVDTKPDLKQLTVAGGAHCKSVDAGDLDACIEQATCEVEAIVGAPWERTEAYEVLYGDDTRRLQLDAECIICVNKVEMSEVSKNGPWFEVECCFDEWGGIIRGRQDCCTQVWPKGCFVRVRYEHGLTGKCCRLAAGVIAAVAGRKAEACSNAGVKSRTMGSYSETFHDEETTVGSVTAGEMALLQKCCD